MLSALWTANKLDYIRISAISSAPLPGNERIDDYEK